jgi:CPA2 family monovalent cation:H+ antiporter-2
VSLVVAAAFISIALNPVMFTATDVLRGILVRRSRWARKLEFESDLLAVLPTGHDIEPPTGHVILIGYGRVGRRIFTRLTEQGIDCVVIEMTRERVEDLRRQGYLALAGDGSSSSVLQEAGITRADAVVVATPTPESVTGASDAARSLNPDVRLILRTHSEDDGLALRREAFGPVFFGEEELANSMVQPLLDARPDPAGSGGD